MTAETSKLIPKVPNQQVKQLCESSLFILAFSSIRLIFSNFYCIKILLSCIKQQDKTCHFIKQTTLNNIFIEREDMHTGKLLKKVGDRNIFQLYSIVFVCLKWLIVSLTVFLPSYLLSTPTFTCGSDKRVNEFVACQKITQCSIELPYTITAELNLYCDHKYLRDSIISSQFVGSVTGLILLSILADYLGRKIIIVNTLFCTAFGSIILFLGAKYNTIPLLYIGLFMMGFGGYSLSMVSYSYLSEINNDLWRQKSLILTYSFWSMGEIMLFPIIRYITSWQEIIFYIFILPLFALILMSYFITETPQFFFMKERYEQCLETLNYVAKFNGRPQLASLQGLEKRSQDKQVNIITDTFTKSKFLIPLIILSFAQVCNNGLYYTTQYSITQLGASFEVNMLIIGSLQFCSCLITNFYCDRMFRKKWIIIFMLLSGSLGVLVQFTNLQYLELAFIGLSRLFNTFGFALFSLITTQSFPTEIKSTGTGISEAMSNLGNMGAPFLLSGAGQIGVKGVFLGGFACIAGGLSMFFVKQTKSKTPEKQQLNQQFQPSKSETKIQQNQRTLIQRQQ